MIEKLPNTVKNEIGKSLDLNSYCNLMKTINFTNLDNYSFLRHKTIFGGVKFYSDIDYKSLLLAVNRGLFNNSANYLIRTKRVTNNGEEIPIKVNCKGHYQCICNVKK